MDTQESKSLAALLSIESIGQGTISNLARELENSEISWKEFWEGGESLWKKLSISDSKIDSIQKFLEEQTIDAYYEKLKARSIRVICKSSFEYPPLLRELDNPPAVLFAQGALMDWQDGLPVAVVGTRHMTAYGKLVTEKITRELVFSGAQIISGFMYGVDTCAHLAALESQGKTVGVLGFGFNHMYPKSHEKVYRECLENGMSFISPFSPDVQPNKGNFPARNAVVAGMSAAVVVTEAAEKSGTHITAGFAADLGRTVCAVPGPITSPYSQGTKALVNQGATLVSSGSEVLEACGAENQSIRSVNNGVVSNTKLTEQQQKLYAALCSFANCGLDDLMQSTALPAEVVLEELVLLEMAGFLQRDGDHWQIIK